MKSSKLNEKLLVLRLQKKDPDAFGKMYDLYVTPLYRFIYLKVSSAQDAEDLTSEVFLKVWKYVTTTDKPIENFRALIYQTARNSVIDHYRRRAKKELPAEDGEMELVVDERQQSILQEIDIQIEFKNVESVLRRMKDEYREAVILRYVEGLEIKEIAAILEKSNGAVRVLLSRALKVTRDLLEQDSTTTDAKQ